MAETKASIGLMGAITGLLASLARMDWYMFLLFLIVLILDVVTGIIAKLRKGEFDSHILKDKLLGKVQEIIAVFGLMVLVVAIQEIGIEIPLIGDNIQYTDKMLIGMFLFKDIYSVLENTDNVPEVIKKWVERLNDFNGED